MSNDEASDSRQKAEHFLKQQEAKWGVITPIVAALRRSREDNHFSARIANMWEGQK